MSIKPLVVGCACVMLFLGASALLGASPVRGEEEYSYVEFVTGSRLSFNATATVGEVFDSYPYFQSVQWKQYPHLDRMIVEATAVYDAAGALAALRDGVMAQDPPGDITFYGKSLDEFAEVKIILYFSVDQNMTEVGMPSTSGLVRCNNGKNRTFQPGGVQVIYDSVPPPISTLYRQCYN